MAAKFFVGDDVPRRKGSSSSEVVTSKSEYRSYPDVDDDLGGEEQDDVFPMANLGQYNRPPVRRAISMSESQPHGGHPVKTTRVRRSSDSDIQNSPKGRMLRRKLSVQEFGSEVISMIRDEFGVTDSALDRPLVDDLTEGIRSTLARQLSGDRADRYAQLRFTIRLKFEHKCIVDKVGSESIMCKSVLAQNADSLLVCCPTSSEILKVDRQGQIARSYKTEGLVQPSQILPLYNEPTRFYAVLCNYGRTVAFVDEHFDNKIREVRGTWKGIITMATYNGEQILCVAKEKNEPKVAFYYVNYKTFEVSNKCIVSDILVHETEIWDSVVTTSDSKILLCLNQKGCIYKYNPEGQKLQTIQMSDNRLKSDPKLKASRPSALCRDRRNNLYMLDGDNKLFFYDSTEMKWYLVNKHVKACSFDVHRDKLYCVGLFGNITVFTII